MQLRGGTAFKALLAISEVIFGRGSGKLHFHFVGYSDILYNDCCKA